MQLKEALRGLDYAQQVQMLSPGPDGEAMRADVQAKAASGIRSGGGPLPHREQIQRSFGRYDVSDVIAHTDAQAAFAAESMGADAYATGDHVVLGQGGRDLHTEAHEAAHVVQQRGGVSLSGGVGQAGDRYEQHADQVADLVVQGKSAEGLLGELAGSGGEGGGAVQRRESTDQRPEICGPSQMPVEGAHASEADQATRCLSGDMLVDHSDGAVDIAVFHHMEDERIYQAGLPGLMGRVASYQAALTAGCQAAVDRAQAWAASESVVAMEQLQEGGGSWLDILISAGAAPLKGPYALIGQFIVERIVAAVRTEQEVDALNVALGEQAFRDTGLSVASDTLIGAYMGGLGTHLSRVFSLVGELRGVMAPSGSDRTDPVQRARAGKPIDSEEDGVRAVSRERLAIRHASFTRLWKALQGSVDEMAAAVATLKAVAEAAYAELIVKYLNLKSGDRGSATGGAVEFAGKVLPVPRGGVGVFPAVELSRFSLSDDVGGLTKEFVGQLTLADFARQGLAVTIRLGFNGVSREFRQSASGGRNSPVPNGMDRYRGQQPSPVAEADISAVIWDILSRAPVSELFSGRRLP